MAALQFAATAGRNKLHRGRIFAYLRVSREKQADSGLGLEAQLDTIKEFCKQHRLTFDPADRTLALLRQCLDKSLPDNKRAEAYVELEAIGLYVDVESGKHRMKDRQAGTRMLLEAAAGDTIIVSKLDRAFRNLRDFCDTFEKMGALGVSFCIVQLGGMAIDFRTPVGKLILHIMAAVAQFEREMIAERTREGLAASKRRGNRQGNWAPIGYKWRCKTGYVPRGGGMFELVPDPDMQDCIAWMKELNTSGYTFQQIYEQFCRGPKGVKRLLWHKHRVPLGRPGEYRRTIVAKETEWTPARIREVVQDLIEFDRDLLAKEYRNSTSAPQLLETIDTARVTLAES
jgi:DNA invertase Pin-like site-specific DNA recombinase